MNLDRVRRNAAITTAARAFAARRGLRIGSPGVIRSMVGLPFELLESKLRPPRVSGAGVTADRAGRAAQPRGRDSPIVMLCAGPGYGKTTALAQWAESQPSAAVRLGLGRPARQRPRRAAHVRRGLRSTASRRSTRGVFEALASPGASIEATVVPRLGAALASVGSSPWCWCSTTFTRSSNPRCIDAIVALAGHVTEGSQLALSARDRSALPLGLLRTRGLGLELGPDDLRMDEHEAGELLRATGLDDRRRGRRRAGPANGGLAGRAVSRRALRRDDRRRPPSRSARSRATTRSSPISCARSSVAHLPPRAAAVPHPDEHARAAVRAAVRRGAGVERFGRDPRVAGALQPVRGRPRSRGRVVPLSSARQGTAGRRAHAVRARRSSRRCSIARPTGARRTGTRSPRSATAQTDGRPGSRRGAHGALDHAGVPERPHRHRRAVVRVAGRERRREPIPVGGGDRRDVPRRDGSPDGIRPLCRPGRAGHVRRTAAGRQRVDRVLARHAARVPRPERHRGDAGGRHARRPARWPPTACGTPSRWCCSASRRS